MRKYLQIDLLYYNQTYIVQGQLPPPPPDPPAYEDDRHSTQAEVIVEININKNHETSSHKSLDEEPTQLDSLEPIEIHEVEHSETKPDQADDAFEKDQDVVAEDIKNNNELLTGVVITESVNDTEEIQEISTRFEEPIEVNVQTECSEKSSEPIEVNVQTVISSNDGNIDNNFVEENKPDQADDNNNHEPESECSEKSSEPEGSKVIEESPPEYEEEFKKEASEVVTDENQNKEEEVKPEVVLPPVEVGWFKIIFRLFALPLISYL